MSDVDRVSALLRDLLRQAAFAGMRLSELSGLSATDQRALGVLDALAEDPADATPSRLAATLALSPSTTTALLDRLERAGLVERARDLPDRRQVRLRLTEKARSFGQEVVQPLASRIDRAAAALEPDDARTVAAFLAEAAGADAGPEAG